MLVFVASKERAKALHAELMYESVHVDSIHADQSQAARSAAVTSFRKGTTWVLIATDLLARGMDFLGVQTVINYDFPNTKTDYIHRCAALCVRMQGSALLAGWCSASITANRAHPTHAWQQSDLVQGSTNLIWFLPAYPSCVHADWLAQSHRIELSVRTCTDCVLVKQLRSLEHRKMI